MFLWLSNPWRVWYSRWSAPNLLTVNSRPSSYDTPLKPIYNAQACIHYRESYSRIYSSANLPLSYTVYPHAYKSTQQQILVSKYRNQGATYSWNIRLAILPQAQLSRNKWRTLSVHFLSLFCTNFTKLVSFELKPLTPASAQSLSIKFTFSSA